MPRDARALAHGTVRDWIDAMAAHQALQSPAGLHATAIGLAPLILRSLGWPSFLMHLHGDTRTAETCARIASSIWGAHEALRLDWSCTARELEDAIIAARDSLVILTSYDATQADKVRAVASALRARDRMPDNGRSVVLSTGARSIDLSALEPGQTTPFNIDIRSWQLPEDPRKLESALSRCTGAMGQAAVLELQRLSQQRRIGDEYAMETAYEQLEAFINASKFSAGASSDRATDAVRAFATLYLALNWNSWILAQAGIEDDMALEVFLASTRAWRDQQHPGDRGDTVVLARIAAQLDALCQDRLAPLTGGQGPEFDAHIDGWMDADWLYLPTDTLRGVANDVGGTTLPALSKFLDAQGLLDTNASRGRTYRMPSGVRGRPSVYKISRRVLDAAA